MRVWALLVLLSVVPGISSKFLELRVDVDFPGDDIQQISSPDAYHCQLACTEHSSCLFFTFVRSDWAVDNRNFYCYLKYTANGVPSKVSALKGVTSGFSLSRLGYKTDTCWSVDSDWDPIKVVSMAICCVIAMTLCGLRQQDWDARRSDFSRPPHCLNDFIS